MPQEKKLTEEQKQRLQTAITSIRDQLKVTKIVCTRSVKGKGGETYVGMASAWDSVQEDSGHNLVHTGETEESSSIQGRSLNDAKLAAAVLGLTVDRLAHQRAVAGGVISEEDYLRADQAITSNYSQMIVSILGLDK